MGFTDARVFCQPAKPWQSLVNSYIIFNAKASSTAHSSSSDITDIHHGRSEVQISDDYMDLITHQL